MKSSFWDKDGTKSVLASLIAIVIGLLAGSVIIVIVGLTNSTMGPKGVWEGVRLVIAGLFSTGRDAAGKLTFGFNPTTFGNMLFRAMPLVMTGREVFKLAVRACIKDVDVILEKNGMTGNDIDMYLLHQANLRIIDSIREHLEQPKEKFPTNMQKYGNTSSASIPILIDEMSRGGELKEGMNVLLSAFGGGFVTGAAIGKWHEIHYDEPAESATETDKH